MDPRYLEFGRKEYIIHSSRPLRRDTLWLQIKWKQYDQSEEKVHNHFAFFFINATISQLTVSNATLAYNLLTLSQCYWEDGYTKPCWFSL